MVEISYTGSLGLLQQSAEQRWLKQHIHCLRVLEAEGPDQSDRSIVFFPEVQFLNFSLTVFSLLSPRGLTPVCVMSAG